MSVAIVIVVLLLLSVAVAFAVERLVSRWVPERRTVAVRLGDDEPQCRQLAWLDVLVGRTVVDVRRSNEDAGLTLLFDDGTVVDFGWRGSEGRLTVLTRLTPEGLADWHTTRQRDPANVRVAEVD